MAGQAPPPAVSLRLTRRLAHPPEKVFDAWTTREALSRWFGPTDNHTPVVTALDLRPGGIYRIEMRHTGGALHVATGTYREITRPSRLVFTWAWEEKPGEAETLVTVTLRPAGTGCELEIVHEQFVDDAQRGNHEQGWIGCLDRLERALSV